MKVELKLSGVEDTLRLLQSLPPEIVSKRGGPVRAALRKGAVVIQKQAVANLHAVTSNATASGKRESTGLLAKNIIVQRGKPRGGVKGELYRVRPKRKVTYPGRKKEATTIIAAASLLEYGSSKQPAEPWLRPAVASRGQAAIDTITSELNKGIARIVKKLGGKTK
jgi:HK97 gp10 family phage protein